MLERSEIQSFVNSFRPGVIPAAKLPTYFLNVFVGLVFLLAPGGSAAQLGVWEAFTNSVPLYSASGGAIVSSSLVQNAKQNAAALTFYSWNKGTFLAEVGASSNPGSAERPDVTSTAFGRWMGTNWEYSALQETNGRLVLHIHPGKQERSLMNDLEGLLPAQYRFEQIMYRGMTRNTLATLTEGNSGFAGVYQAKFRLAGVLVGEPEAAVLGYTVPDLKLSFTNTMQLKPFPSGGYYPSILKLSQFESGKPTASVSYEFLRVSPTPLNSTLSPFALYPAAEKLEINDDKVFAVAGDTHTEIPQAIQRSTWSINLRRALIMFLLVICGASACWFYLAKHKEDGKAERK